MKLAEFNALCDREWAKQDRGGRGGVVSVTLTEASAEELKRDMLMYPKQFGHILHMTEDDLRRSISCVVNPITRTPVEIRTRETGSRETARVRVPSGYRQTWWRAAHSD